ncbi:MAG TPA: class I SAM-dependent methyltransferase [Tepidisphaeraceae bacterium]|nr:class I SAM-dependent methyltransferase [Tepidisphaeraceae bacterium]
MSFNKSNKMAWEEAFDNRKAGWCEDICERIRNEGYPFLERALLEELSGLDLRGKTIAQFCCNNGRELLSICKMGAAYGVGFDIAENMVSFANTTAKNLRMNCTFLATDILNIDSSFHGTFDYIFVTVGALTWFDDLNAFFGVVSRCLKEGGCLIINEMHPVTNMLAMKGEENFDAASPSKLVNPYFKCDPWIENKGMSYMSDPAKEYTKTFYSYTHTFGGIVNAIVNSDMQISRVKEYEHDISESFSELDNKGIPMSYVLVAKR